MSQQINLYEKMKAKSLVLSIQCMLYIVISLVALLLISSLYSTYNIFSTKHNIAELHKQQQQLQTKITMAKHAIPTEELQRQAKQELLAWEKVNDEKQQLHSVAASIYGREGNGFYAYLDPIINNIMPEVTIRVFKVNAFNKIYMQGFAKEHANVPQYLKVLGKHKKFTGLRFDKVTIEEKEQQIRFTVEP